MAKLMTNEFFVRYIKDFTDYNAIFESSCKSWNSVAKNQLKRKVKYLEDVMEGDSETKSFEIGFQNGSKAYFLFIPNNCSTYLLHTEIQATFASGIKEHDKISFNILGLQQKLQQTLITSLSSAIHLYQWSYPTYGKKSKKKSSRKVKKEYGFYSNLDNDKIDELIGYGEAIAKGTNLARTMASTPSNYMDSKALKNKAAEVAKKTKTSFKFIDENALKNFKAGCFLSVIQGSKGSEGGIAHLKYKTKTKNAKTIAIIGKGVVFDTGGYDIKTDSSMENMHRDMTGAAVSLALFQALAETKAKVNIELFLAIGENLISEKSYKPNDVVVAMDGTSVEIINTDAEGRMLLIDTILYSKAFKPDLILDFATLTGDAVAAIGNRYSCAFSNSRDLDLSAIDAGIESGERVWPFPLTEDFQKTLESDVADIRQCTTSSFAEHIHAACLLKHFIGQTPWIHIDLSSESCDGGLGMVDTEVTGFGVRWGFQFIHNFLIKKKR